MVYLVNDQKYANQLKSVARISQEVFLATSKTCSNHPEVVCSPELVGYWLVINLQQLFISGKMPFDSQSLVIQFQVVGDQLIMSVTVNQ